MRDLFTSPLSGPEDLASPMPVDEHAVSLALPTWQSLIDYEEGDSSLEEKIRLGYPRFVLHEAILSACDALLEKTDTSLSYCLPFPSLGAAGRAESWLKRRSPSSKLETVVDRGVYFLACEEESSQFLFEYWQHSGDVVSSRLIESYLSGRDLEKAGGEGSELEVEGHLASCFEKVSKENIFITPSGMAAFSLAHRVLCERSPGAKTIQISLPYLDSLKLQEKSGTDCLNLHARDGELLEKLKSALEESATAGVFVEVPSNALLYCPDLVSIYNLAKDYGVPVVCDDTIGTSLNLSIDSYCDLVVSSLTKTFAGSGTVMAGSLCLPNGSPLFSELKRRLEASHDTSLFSADREVLFEVSKDYESRFLQMEKTAEGLVGFLQKNFPLQEINYPKLEGRANYESLRKQGRSGYGFLFSFVLEGAKEVTPKFYDSLNLCKGPSLGTNFTLVCPYTMLAHYHELDKVSAYGLSPYLIRVSVGLEKLEVLKSRFSEALDAALP